MPAQQAAAHQHQNNKSNEKGLHAIDFREDSLHSNVTESSAIVRGKSSSLQYSVDHQEVT
jgi:hypothetical protein